MSKHDAVLWMAWRGRYRCNDPVCLMSSELIRRNVCADQRVNKKSRSSHVRLAIHGTAGVDLQHIIAQRVTRQPPFYLMIIRQPKETLFCSSKEGNQNELAIGTWRTFHCASLCSSHVVNQVGFQQYGSKARPQTVRTAEFHVVISPHTDSKSRKMGTHYRITLQDYFCARCPH